jgi:hypothetical protein
LIWQRLCRESDWTRDCRKLSHLAGGEPAERDDLEAPTERLVDGLGRGGGEIGRVGGIDVVAGAADDGFANRMGGDGAVGIPGVAIGADGEGVVAGG